MYILEKGLLFCVNCDTMDKIQKEGTKMQEMLIVREATSEDIETLWDDNIMRNPGDDRWVRWKKEYVGYNESGMAKTFTVIADGHPVGEGTLLFDPLCKAIRGRTVLADGQSTANINALRIRHAFEGQGHISRLVKIMEKYAWEHGFSRVTIGVEATETRNLAIYLHFGYTKFIMSEVEDGALVLYYGKDLKPTI